ncbi:MAG: M48 family metallopeptidase, partial [Muribaculaceae bacterium]|nr:M48 family metallopeptidase [Muribaculaceae bacterium]
MKIKSIKLIAVAVMLAIATPAFAQFNKAKLIKGAGKAVQAMTITDEQMAAYVKEYIDWMDKHNPVTGPDNEYTKRLARLTEGLTSVEGIPLNFKVYDVIDVNAFACPDGSVRVFSSLMDIMTDEELLGVIGHEMGHVAHKDSKKAFRQALLTSALKDAVASTNGVAAALTDSQLGSLGEALASASYSQKQEKAADDYGYEFLKAHDKNPWAMAFSFRRLKALQEQAGAQKTSKMNQLFSSHPDLDLRIQRMEERATKAVSYTH